MTTAYDVMISQWVRELMEAGKDVEEARDYLQSEVDTACDEIAYGGNEE